MRGGALKGVARFFRSLSCGKILPENASNYLKHRSRPMEDPGQFSMIHYFQVVIRISRQSFDVTCNFMIYLEKKTI